MEQLRLKEAFSILGLILILLFVVVAMIGCTSTQVPCVPKTEVHEVPVVKLVNACEGINVKPLPKPSLLKENATVEEKLTRAGNWIEVLEEYSKELKMKLDACAKKVPGNGR